MDRQLFTKDRLTGFLKITMSLRIAKAIKWLIPVAVVFVIVINLTDEDLRPEVVAYLQPERPDVANERNAYYAVVGLAAPAQDQPHAAGLKLVTQLLKADAQRLKGEPTSHLSWPVAFRLNSSVEEALLGICRPARGSCIDWVSQNRQDAVNLLASNERLLARYLSLYQYPVYFEAWTRRYGGSEDIAGPLRPAKRMFLARTALLLADGNLDTALGDLRKDIAFYRRALVGARQTKQTMSSQLEDSLRMLADALARYGGEIAARAAMFDEVLRPLRDDERRLGTALRADFAMRATFYAEIDALFWRPNATINRAFIAYKIRSDSDAVSAAEFARQATSVRASLPPSDWPHIGKRIFPPPAAAEFGEEQYQMYDLDALVRLVALQAKIVAQKITDADLAKFLAGTDGRYRNPYTGEPMRWDEKARRLCFEPQSMRYGSADRLRRCCPSPNPGPVCVRVPAEA